MAPKARAQLPLKPSSRPGKRSLAAADAVYADETVPSTELRQNASEIVSRVAYGGHNIIVTRNGKPAAALVPMRSLKLLQALENRIDVVAALLAKGEIADADTVSLADLKAELGL